MLIKKNTWCPETKDYCKGEACVCHKTRPKAVRGAQGTIAVAAPFCELYQVYLPEDKRAEERAKGGQDG